MTDEQLSALDKVGFIPGPGESENDFIARTNRAKEKFDKGSWIPMSHWDWTLDYLEYLFNVKPLYICAFYSNRNLSLWEGGACWLLGTEVESIQLRKKLKEKRRYLFYKRDEILSHEAIHFVRSGFEGSQFEEFFAYMSSEKPSRRVLGPLIQSPWEICPFFIFVGASILFPFLYWAACIWLGMGFVRLIRLHRILGKAMKKISSEVGDPKKARAVLLRLTDEEIRRFAKGEELKKYAKKQDCLRWRAIRNHLKE